MKPQFEKHEDQLFRMLEEPVPLTPDAEMPRLVRLIQDDSPMGRYNKAYSEYKYGVKLGCCLLPIIATHIAKNGVVNDIEWDVSRYEIIGTLVKEGSSEWALYQMMQGETVCQKYSRIKRYYEAGYVRWMMPHNKEISQHLPADVFLKNFAGTMNWQIYTEPLAPEGTAEWAWQMMLLGNEVWNPELDLHKGKRTMSQVLSIYYIDGGNIMVRSLSGERSVLGVQKDSYWAVYAEPTGWQLYEPKPEPQPAKEPIANCENCKHVCTNSNIDHCHMYEPKPEPKNIIHGYIPPDMRLKYIDLGIYKVGDWVEWCGDQYIVESAPPQSGGRYDIRSPYDELGCSVYPENITRKLDPSEVVIRIGCLSGTVAPVSINGIHIWFHLIGVDDRTIATIRISSLDTQTRELVESLFKAMRGES